MVFATKGPAPAGAGPLECHLLDGFDNQVNSPSQDQKQAQIIRLVPPPRPRRLEVRISARHGPEPAGRTRPLRLTDRDVEQLVDFALRLEGRAS